MNSETPMSPAGMTEKIARLLTMAEMKQELGNLDSGGPSSDQVPGVLPGAAAETDVNDTEDDQLMPFGITQMKFPFLSSIRRKSADGSRDSGLPFSPSPSLPSRRGSLLKGALALLRLPQRSNSVNLPLNFTPDDAWRLGSGLGQFMDKYRTIRAQKRAVSLQENRLLL